MELSKNFEPKSAEEKWYRYWMEKGYFSSQPDERPAFTVVIPPPNVTGVLHMGHTLNETVQDILVRRARMKGFNACWVPGSDHASIATEARVVKMLETEKGIKKSDLSREDFLKYAFEWKEKYGDIIYHQIKKLGCSVDWNRVTFTMDSHYYEAVIKVFADLYNKGLIYRGARMINWDPSAKTALSDEEVEYRDIEGKLYHVKYRIAPSNNSNEEEEYIIIATQRPETIMGDTAVCVHPDDERYRHLKGRDVIVPMVNRKVPLIYDEYVDPEFGTGALKITPAHDINDYNLGLKHGLPVIDTLNEDGTLSDAAEIFIGLDRFEAREKAIELLKKEGSLVKEETYTTRLGFSQRTNAVVEPRISTQWFVRMQELAGSALNAVTSGDIKIHPEERFLATYKYWLENVKDWCISRQLWWGQRIPAYYAPDGTFAVATTREEAVAELKKLQPDLRNEDINQDEDVLDTWFSSWLWPIEVFNGITEPENKDIQYYYPTSVLVTGQDIIFFWVARMIMAGMEYMKERPFEHVYFTGMVRDSQGRKMSKSLGNSPDLLDLIDRFGADAVRFGIMISSPAGSDLLFDESGLVQGRNFNNKIWNALRLVKGWEARQSPNGDENGFAIQWLGERIKLARTQVDELCNNFRLSEALKLLYSLIWDDFCSWYLEWIKPAADAEMNSSTYMATVEYFEELMQLLHPFMPFITEEVYHILSGSSNGDLVVKQYRPAQKADRLMLEKAEIVKKRITDIRDARKKFQLGSKTPILLQVISASFEIYKEAESIIRKQVNASEIIETGAVPRDMLAVNSDKDQIFIEVKGDASSTTTSNVKEIQNQELEKELKYLQGFLISVEKKLGNEKFMANAKPEVIALEQKKKSDAMERMENIKKLLKV